MRGAVSASRANAADHLRRRALQLVYATVAWNAVEGATAVAAGLIAHSVALTAFGLDSSVEVFVSLVAVWQMRAATRFRRRVGLRLIGVSFLAVAVYVSLEAMRRLVGAERAQLSIVGMAVTCAAIPIMAALGVAKHRIAGRIGNAVLGAEARFSLVDASLSAAVLLGLVLDRALSWWWADPAVALIVAGFAAREGVDNLWARKS